ncbi:MAG TPA: VanZ family protein [Thermomicrobiales bacterium]|nr:VanZ family protein [Thermomicrobiales bacterium]
MPTAIPAPIRIAARFLPALAWMAFLFALSARSRLPTPLGLTADTVAALGHLGVYAVLAVLLWRAIPPGRWNRFRFVLAFLGAMAFGVGDEAHQAFVPGREPSLLDLGLDAAGAVGGLAAVAVVRSWRERGVAGGTDHQTVSPPNAGD